MENFINFKKDSHQEISQKRNLSMALVKNSKDRNFKDIGDLKKFFNKYEYFKKMIATHGERAFEGVMRIIKIMGIPSEKYLIEEGEMGDRFYFILQGSLEVFKSQEKKLKDPEKDGDRVVHYLDYIYSHKEMIHWHLVPYAQAVQRLLNKVEAYKNGLVKILIKDIYRLFGQSFLVRFQLLNRSLAKKDGNYLTKSAEDNEESRVLTQKSRMKEHLTSENIETS